MQGIQGHRKREHTPKLEGGLGVYPQEELDQHKVTIYSYRNGGQANQDPRRIYS